MTSGLHPVVDARLKKYAPDFLFEDQIHHKIASDYKRTQHLCLS